METLKSFFNSPRREYTIIIFVLILLIITYFFPPLMIWLFFGSIIGSITIFEKSIRALFERRITIDTFNTFALGISFATQEIRSAAFIVLMLAFADALEWHTSSRTKNAVEELLKLKPLTAFRENKDIIEEIPVDRVNRGDILVVKSGSRVPVDGIVIYGSAMLNESPVTGESALVQKIIGDQVISSTLNESGILKIRATRVGKESTIEQMAALMEEASKNKSRSEKMADRFAAIFLPVVAILGIITYILTKDITMTAAIFLIACADDIAVAIPLAMTASLGQAAKRGVIIKGGEWLDAIGKTKTVVLDKTGTLTYGKLSIKNVRIEPGVKKDDFWRYAAVVEKFSEHPVGKAVFREAAKNISDVPDPDKFEVFVGHGVRAFFSGKEILAGDEDILENHKTKQTPYIRSAIAEERKKEKGTTIAVVVDGALAGVLTVADIPRIEAKKSIQAMQEAGVDRVLMFTGDNQVIAQEIASVLNIKEFRASMQPNEKLGEIEELSKNGSVAMVGDGINDAPALARANVGVAMGSGGTAVAVEAADMVILSDDLSRLPEMIVLGRKTTSVIHGNIIIWLISNIVGFALVFTGIAGPAFAAFYNFATDFFPLLNSARLFKMFKD
ncbi:cation-translocating P-type ATPase [Candidatus Azambacteria bacterium]|nr:cation-translocating P-type ATPase [Candidatus Azambacteria bacterium]